MLDPLLWHSIRPNGGTIWVSILQPEGTAPYELMSHILAYLRSLRNQLVIYSEMPFWAIS
jgi:hypothetical protein